MKSKRYIQRELSWNDFNARVLYEALRVDNKLLDRLNFIAITSSNYDEFFKVRIAGLMRKIQNDDPLSAGTLNKLLKEAGKVIKRQDRAVSRIIIPELANNGLKILSPEKWKSEENQKADHIFETEIFPSVTPLAIPKDSALSSIVSQNHIYIAFSLDDSRLAVIRVPDNIERFRNLHISRKKRIIILLEDILQTRGEQFFPGHKVESSCFFRITGDADMNVDEERDDDFIAAIEEVLENRNKSFPVRLETRGDAALAGQLREKLNIVESIHFHLQSPLNLAAFSKLLLIPGFENLRASRPGPKSAEDLSESDDIWATLKERDILLHHPYETFAPVIRMVEEAAEDAATLAVKMTLYRTDRDSSIVNALIKAAERGVQVTVLVELKARFDEGANISNAARLEKAGAIVIFGLEVLKVHVKALMVIRREDEGIRRYLHLSTGNYNGTTAKLYTDIGLMTARDNYTRDAALMFNAITGYSSDPQLETLFMAPFTLRREILRLILREKKRALEGEESGITAKMNSLVDEEIIETLYEASNAGVKINLNIRGTCCLRPGVKGLSENIQVISIIDTFLEHTRAFVFHNGGRTEVYLSSADWMARNLDRRVELLFPIADSGHKRRIGSILDSYFKDNCRSWRLHPNGKWERNRPAQGEPIFRVQNYLAEQAAAVAAGRMDIEKKALKVRR